MNTFFSIQFVLNLNQVKFVDEIYELEIEIKENLFGYDV